MFPTTHRNGSSANWKLREMQEGFTADDDDEWLSFNDLFSPAPLVPPGAETFEFAAPGRMLHLTQSISSFTRRDGEATGAAERGADHARNTSALIWDASVVLASWFAQHHATLLTAGASCVELGSGAGLTGLTAAACGYPTTLTDRAEALPGLSRDTRRTSCSASRCMRSCSPASISGKSSSPF